MQTVDTPPFNSTLDLIRAVREERWKTGLNPSTCLRNLCRRRRIFLESSDKHTILSEIAKLAATAKKAKVHQKKLREEQKAMLPLMFAKKTTSMVNQANQETAVTAVPTQTHRETIIVQGLLPGMTVVNLFNDRPHNWRKCRK